MVWGFVRVFGSGSEAQRRGVVIVLLGNEGRTVVDVNWWDLDFSQPERERRWP